MVTQARAPVRRPLAGIALLAIAASALIAIGRLLATPAWDVAMLTGLRTHATPTLTRSVADISALGGGTVLTLLVAAVAGLLLAQRQWRAAALLAAACWTGGRVAALAKAAVARPRPDLVDHLVPVANASFPSSHAANSAVVYLLIAALAARGMAERAGRRWVFALAVMLTLAICSSRVYLGVHWPSDVVAGWAFGAAWAVGWWWIGLRSALVTRTTIA